MNLLLDTHILLWYINDDPRLTKKAKDIISDSDNEVYFSTLSVWEIQIKKDIYPNFEIKNINNFVVDLIDYGFKPLPFYPKHIYQLENLKLKNENVIHKDPFDNGLLAQAKSCKIKFMSHDRCFKNYDEDCLIMV